MIPNFEFLYGRNTLDLIPKPRYAWAMVAGAVVSIGTSVYSASQNKKIAPQQAAAIDPQAVQNSTIAGNQANQAAIEKLVSSTNSFDQSQASSLMEKAMPGYGSLSKSLTSQAQKLADNPYSVPTDVQNNLQRLAAEKGVSTGRNGQAGQFSLLRDLGVNELQQGQSNLNQASSITSLLSSIAPKVNPMSPMSMYLTPQQSLNTAQQNQSMQQAGYNAAAAAQNANTQTQANMWGQIGGAASGAISAGIGAYNASNAGIGSQTTYDQYLKDNPNSSAALGQNAVPQVSTDWSFTNKNGP